MSEGSGGWIRDVVDGLKGHPDALLAFAIVVAAGGLVYAGVNEWLACGFAGGVYVLYCVRAWFADRAKVQLAKQELDRLETDRRRVSGRRPQRRRNGGGNDGGHAG